MGFDKEPDFNIHLDGEVFFNHHPLFDEVFDKFAKQRIFEDIMDIGLEKDDSNFFKKFNFIAQFTRGNQMKNLNLLNILQTFLSLENYLQFQVGYHLML